MIYVLSIAAAVLLLMFAIAWKQEVGAVHARWRSARRGEGDPADTPTRSECLVAIVWTVSLAIFTLFAIALIWKLA